MRTFLERKSAEHNVIDRSVEGIFFNENSLGKNGAITDGITA